MNTLIKTGLLSATILAGSMATADIKNEYLLDENVTIVENAQKVANFSTLVAAVEAAGLADELMGEGPYTIFVPTDEAFAALPEGTVEELLQPENKDRLASILQAHVVDGLFSSSDMERFLVSGDADPADVDVMVEEQMLEFDTLITSDIFVEKSGDAFYVTSDTGTDDNARIIEADIMSSNGIIHVIDKVLMPNM